MSLTFKSDDIKNELIKLDNAYNDDNIRAYLNVIVVELPGTKDVVKQVEAIIKDWLDITTNGIGTYFYDKYGIVFQDINNEYYPEENIVKVFFTFTIDQLASISNSRLYKNNK